jgi:hypothetical protein
MSYGWQERTTVHDELRLDMVALRGTGCCEGLLQSMSGCLFAARSRARRPMFLDDSRQGAQSFIGFS